MKELIQSFRDMKIRKKLVGTYIIIVLVPLLMVGIILTNGMKDMVLDQAIKEANINTERFQVRFREILVGITEVSDRLYVNPRFLDILEREYKSDWEIIEAYYSFNEFDEFIMSYKELRGIKIYAYNKMLIDNWDFKIVTPEVSEQPWFKKAVEMNGEVLWQYIFDEDLHEYYLCLTRLVKKQYTGMKLGVLVIPVDNTYLQSIINEEPFETIVSTDSGTVVFSKDMSLQGRGVNDEGLEFINRESDKSVGDIVYRGNPSKVITTSFRSYKSRNVFNILTIVPIDAITERAGKISALGFNIMGLSFIVSLVLLTFFARMLSGRIIKLRKEMHKVVQGDFEINANIYGMDEIGELYDDLHTMIKSIRRLIYEIYEQKLSKEQMVSRQREIEFKMLANQINPHFLYNSLETIRMRAHSKGDSEIAGVVKMLARIMRRNLEATSKLVSLESELELLSNYLDIQRFRYEDKINYEISVLSDIKDYYVLPLLLQPIVENAFIHGLEGIRGPGTINVVIEEKDKSLVITVEDNGAGINEEKMDYLHSMLEESENDVKTSIGLRNVNSRIKLYYGSEYGVRISSRLNEGTRVMIYLPKKEEYPVC